MAKNIKDQLTSWLKDAYAMEKGMIEALEAHAADAREQGYLQLADRIEEHLEETKSQAERVETCLKGLGSDTSGAREFFAQAGASMKAMSGKMADDQVVKAGIADYATEYFEVASYESIIAAAEACEEGDVAALCREILEEEEAMGEWLRENLPKVVHQYLETQATED